MFPGYRSPACASIVGTTSATAQPMRNGMTASHRCAPTRTNTATHTAAATADRTTATALVRSTRGDSVTRATIRPTQCEASIQVETEALNPAACRYVEIHPANAASFPPPSSNAAASQRKPGRRANQPTLFKLRRSAVALAKAERRTACPSEWGGETIAVAGGTHAHANATTAASTPPATTT